MINPIDPTARRPQTTVQPSTPPQAKPKPLAATQVLPAQSVLNLAQSELGTDMQELGSIFPVEESCAETLENMSFALGTQARERMRGLSSSADRARPRSMMQRLAKQVSATAPDHLEELRQRVPGIEAVEEVDDLLNSLRQHQFDAGEMALLLAAMLGKDGLSPTRRRRLEEALDRVMDDEDWALQLFSHLEFGAVGKSGLAELRRLYQRAASRQSGLVYWFGQFRQMDDRQRKLKTLIRALAFELSAQGGATDIRLAAVITDLKRVLQFLGMEDHCDRVAKALAIPELDGNRIIEELLEIIQQSWVYPDWLSSRADALMPEEHSRHGYARRMGELVKLLPDDCFEDIDQRETILAAFLEYQEQLADEE
ncbi:type III secretion system gatekeeper subunit SctW [Chromobacterium sp. CV08]|uniref:type III secretion system gatekeeper subunit SctW n=1 Tax=Chromobacterium sp. CV08 TaxID=3133274 RepID=UPI003DA8D71F